MTEPTHNPDCDVMDINPDGIVKPCNCARRISWAGVDPICPICRKPATWVWITGDGFTWSGHSADARSLIEDGSDVEFLWGKKCVTVFASCDQHRKAVMRANGLAKVRGRKKT